MKIKGYVSNIRYRKEETGYTVFELMSEDDEITCVGNLTRLDVGESIEVTGELTMHPAYGEQIHVTSYEPVTDDNPDSLKRYLGSGAIRGIGEALAGRIVSKFGADTMRILEEEPERLSEVKGISERKAREIAVQFQEKSDARAAFMFLQEYGISNNMSIRIYEEYGDSIYSIMKENPYRLAEDIRGIGFKMADEIASRGGIQVDSQYRIKSGVLYVLLEASAEGNMFLWMNDLLHKASALLDLPGEAIRTEVNNLSMERKLVLKKNDEDTENPQVYAYHYYYTELNCAAMLHDLNLHMSESLLPSEEELIERRIKKLENELGIQYDELQHKAVKTAATNCILILSGGPGTGKTTTINAMINYFYNEEMDILLAAPTGRAAKRMSEATGYEAKTIHRLLELSGAPDDDRSRARFERNEENPLDADVIIVDEMSMVDVFLFQSLLKAITPGTRLILVGDIDQLPSVGPGQVLRDLIFSKAFPVVVLEHIFRQSEDSDIIINAHNIRNGKYPILNNKSKDFFFLSRNAIDVIYKHMVQLITEKLPPYVSATSYDIQVLTPMRKGALGVETLNSVLQKYINPESSAKRQIEASGTVFREGDKVMQIKNNYQLDGRLSVNSTYP